MTGNDLNPLSYLVLALVGRGGAGPHDLVDMMRRGGRLYWSAAPSKLYAEPKRLAARGYLTAETAPGRTGPRTVYRLTAQGERAVAAWIAAPSRFPRLQHEAVARLLAADLGDDEDLRRSLSAMRAEVDELEALLAENRARAGALPHRARYLRLVGDLGERLLRAHREWLDEVEAELGTGTGP
ncbi:MAG TPA: PadR family transcriptional regulator [Miltoncostaeaceae bacterium]|nr:PadR family transcriptional regulator [Miltoncostaeaceae bacterium]